MDEFLKAFLSDEFDVVYSRFATAPWAKMASRLDVKSLHVEARQGILSVIGGAQRNADAGSRIIAICGEAGLGKTHCITSELSVYATQGKALPVLMQLADGISENEISRWVLKKVFEEISSTAFSDEKGRTPVQALSERLWEKAKQATHRAYIAAIDSEQFETAEALAVEAASQIVLTLRPQGLHSDHARIIAGLLLRANDLGYGFKAWINQSQAIQRIAGISLEPLTREDERKAIIVALANIGYAVEAPLVLVFDQIEAADALGSSGLLVSMLSYAIQLVDDGIRGTAVIISALSDTLDVVRPALKGSLKQRLALSPEPVLLTSLTEAGRSELLGIRAKVLLERCGLSPDPRAAELFSPNSLFSHEGTGLPRVVIDAVRRYRERCAAARRFVAPEEAHSSGSQKLETREAEPVSGPSFDKLWQDKKDAAVGGIINLGDFQRLQLLTWYFENAAFEIGGLERISCTPFEIQGHQPINGLDLTFFALGDLAFERWKVAYTDAPPARGQLRDQIQNFLQQCSEAKPAIISPSRITGFNDLGEKDRTEARIQQLVTGPALVLLLQSGGRVVPTNPEIWFELSLARDFFTERAEAAGFDAWRQERGFLTREIRIGAISTLVRPETDPALLSRADTPPLDPGPLSTNLPVVATADEIEANSSTDALHSREAVRLLIGTDGKGTRIYWDLDRQTSPSLPNFGLTVTGDAGQGKTQAIMGVISEVANLGCPILIFDFKNDYTGPFAEKNGFTVLNLRDGLPFNPLRPAPTGAAGAQAIEHIYEISGLLQTTLKLGAQQAGLFRNSLESAFQAKGVPLREWRDPEKISSPSLAEVIKLIEKKGGGTSATLINRLGFLHGLGLLPSDATARLTFKDLLEGRFVLSFNELPNDDALKSALAEMILIQLQGYMLRGEQPRALRRLLVFDEAWRAANSARLTQLAREGRAFGVGVVVGTQFPDDLSPDLVGNLASKLYLYNSDAAKRQRTILSMLGTSTGTNSVDLRNVLHGLQQFEAVLVNQQFTPYQKVRITPYFERTAPQKTKQV
jgi:hypothetical protein